MTNEFRELSNRLAKGLNRSDCNAILISRMEDEDEFVVVNYEAPIVRINAIVALCENVLELDSKLADEVMYANLKAVLTKCEERRFQKGETE